MTLTAIWEEIICDSLADMNVFSGSKMWVEAAEHMGMTIPAVQKAVSEGKANQTRGAPDSNVTKQLAEDLADFIPKHLGLRNIGNKSKAEIVDRYIKNLEDDYSRKTMVKSIQESIKGRWDGFKLTSPELISQAEAFIERIEALDKTISGKASREIEDNDKLIEETEVYERRKETRDEFNRTAYEDGCTLGERGQIAYSYRVSGEPSIEGRKTAEEYEQIKVRKE